MFIYGYTD